MKSLNLLILASFLITSCCFWSSDDVAIVNPWIREAPPNVPMAGYFEIKNTTNVDRTLTSTESALFSSIEFHESVESNGVYKMRRYQTITIPAKGEFDFAPGGYHLMMFNAKKPLRAGDTVDVTLHFDQGEPKVVTFEVKKAN